MPRTDVDKGMIPLINVVFLILAFFVLAGQFDAHHRKLSVPKSSSSVERDTQLQTLIVFADGALALNGQDLNFQDLPTVINEGNFLASSKELIRVLLMADSELLVSDLQILLSELQLLGVTKVNLATLPTVGDPPERLAN